MSDYSLVDPELRPLLDIAPSMGVSASVLREVRARVAEMAILSMENADASVDVAEHHVPGPDGAPPVRVRVYRPKELTGNTPAILHMHGGGFVFGGPDMSDPRHRAQSRLFGCTIVSVDYRLAPEHPYPAAIEDCYAALKWLHETGPSMGVNVNRIAVRGDSAGGNLAAALCLLTRDRGGPSIHFQVLIYPMLDDRTCIDKTPNPHSGHFVWDRPSNAYAWESMLGQAPGDADIAIYAAPSRATNLSGLPPTFIGTAALDLFIDEDLDYAHRLLRAGVPTELYVAPGAFHGFDAMLPDAQVARALTERTVHALQRAFAV